MGDERDKFDWFEDFSILITAQGIRQIRGDLELFTGSKLLASLWLAAVAGLAGAFGGLLVSGALWASLLYPLAWLLAVALASIIVWQATLRLAGSAPAFLAGWCMFWGTLSGAVSGWSAGFNSAGWAYGIAGGVGFLIGITHGNLQHGDIRSHESWFMASTVLAPASSCFATWISRADLLRLAEWLEAGLVGLLASLLFLGPLMVLYLAHWNNERTLLRLASLSLHNDDFISEAIALLDQAIGRSPKDAALFDLRGLAHALAGDMRSAETDWTAQRKMNTSSRATDLSLGWLHLRRDRLDEAAEAFGRAMGGKSSRRWARVGSSLVHLRQGAPAQAFALLRKLPKAKINSRNQTYLAEASLAMGDFAQAVEAANVAIDELDSVHGLSWLIRAEAQIRLGNRDHAIADLNRALVAADEAGIEERALALLEKIEGAVLEEDELEDLERSLSSR